MILGIGIDIVEIVRLKKTCLDYGDRFLRRIFTVAEREYAMKKSDPYASLAVRFAAKEALVKATREGKVHSFDWLDAEVVVSPSGIPFFQLKRELQKTLSGRNVHLSLSHADLYATAVVIIE